MAVSERYQYKITCDISNIIIEMHLPLQGAYTSHILKYIAVVSIWKMSQTQIYIIMRVKLWHIDASDHWVASSNPLRGKFHN